MRSRRAALCVSTLLVLGTAGFVQAQCDAPKNWFPHSSTPEPDFHAPTKDCEFHKWAWQIFLWLTQPTGKDRIRLLDLPTGADLFKAGKGPEPFDAAVRERRTQVLTLSPRVVKRSAPSNFNDIRQAGLRGILMDQNGRAVYYATHVSQTYYQFVRTNRLYDKDTYVNKPPTTNFPVRSLSIKSSWRILLPGEDGSGFYTTSASIYRLICKDGTNNCQGDNIIADLYPQPQPVPVALVGIHVVGVVEDHPEFIWSTFEHRGNVPDLPADMRPDSPEPISGGTYTFYAPNTPAKLCNILNARTVMLDVKRQQLSPLSSIFREFPSGGGDADDQANIKSLNESVRAQLELDSVWKNYFLVGSVWFAGSNRLEPCLTGPYIQRRATGAVRLSNSTMETFTQLGRKNCFSCHDSGSRGELGLPAMNMNLSHVLTDGLVQRDQLFRDAAKAVPVQAAAPRSYAEVQKLLNDFVKKNDVPIQLAPYGAFWNKMSYQEFIEGNIPGISDPQGKPLKVLVVGDPEASNLIRALRGTKGTVFDPIEGTIGRLPPSGPFMNVAYIDLIASWIKQGCHP